MQLFGLFLILLGGLAIINEILPFSFWHYMSIYWPLAFIFYGLYRLIIKRKNDGITWGAIIFFTFIELRKLNLFQGNLLRVLVAFGLIFIGYQLILPKKKRSIFIYSKEEVKNDYFTHDEKDLPNDSEKTASEKVLDTDVLDESYTFESKKIKLLSNTFSGGDLSLNMSQITVDLREVVPLQYITSLSVKTRFSHLILLVPDDWEVNFDNGEIGKVAQGSPNYILNIKDQNIASSIEIK